ncbi:MAG: hypothetical protein LBI64_03195, partial [Coriobacteriales bacterium]|nr:hypothetical protein [Coriobacteriales bacterium]
MPNAPDTRIPDANSGWQRYPHPYHKLGGWLAFYAYGGLIAAGISTISSLYGWFYTLNLLSYFIDIHAAWVFFYSAAEVASCLILIIYALVFFTRIRKKDPRFLRFCEQMFLLSLAFAILIALVGNSPYVDLATRIGTM